MNDGEMVGWMDRVIECNYQLQQAAVQYSHFTQMLCINYLLDPINGVFCVEYRMPSNRIS